MKKKFKKGDIIVLTASSGYGAQKGATAFCEGYYQDGKDTYMSVRWNRENRLVGGQSDGGYYQKDFDLFKEEPINWRGEIQ